MVGTTMSSSCDLVAGMQWFSLMQNYSSLDPLASPCSAQTGVTLHRFILNSCSVPFSTFLSRPILEVSGVVHFGAV